METYCGVWPLQSRRDFLCVKYLFRVRSLQQSEHPVKKIYPEVRASSKRTGGLIEFWFALTRKLKRNQRFTDRGDEFAEYEATLRIAPWCFRPRAKPLPERRVAVLNHMLQVLEQAPNRIRIFTDGSASPHPRKAGAGAIV